MPPRTKAFSFLECKEWTKRQYTSGKINYYGYGGCCGMCHKSNPFHPNKPSWRIIYNKQYKVCCFVAKICLKVETG